MELTGDQLFWLIAIGIGCVGISVWAFIEHLDVRIKARTKLRQTEAREETRRELAAYVAEGSISPDDAAKLMSSGAEGIEGIKMGIKDFFAKGAGGCQGGEV
ncbi:hypothetical protein MNBD_PLANCTO03-787 [hydrothermal vent metagenome]|uniref:Uncharacterized protein n=1 Tax=hydrothermal vent metagenome TaxID=652676 RepID=A0A3B1DWP6_9ZZZZ